MSIIGKSVAHYKITSQIGKGGMGEVYQAKDQKLGRDVAIKVLPDEFARDTGRVSRFQREAKLLASLNHPNIAAIHGLEESDGVHFLVLELVKGETLADQIKKGPVPVEDSLRLALQIAEALEAAHEKGVIHRDLKPANIKVTPDGKVKVLDFGLAKAFAGDHFDLNMSNSPTLSLSATQHGIILGTAAYMSPEQARGRAVDKRTDIWSFGVILYEMLTGKQFFAGETVSDALASVLTKKLDLLTLPPNLHPKIVEILDRCLEKNLKNRCHDIADVRIDIQKILAHSSRDVTQLEKTIEPGIKLREMLPWIAITAIVCLLIAGIAAWKLKPSESPQILRFNYEIPEEQEFRGLNLMQPILAVSPDGRQFAYCTPQGIYLRSLNEIDAKLIPGTDERPQQPFFSPNGEWIGYWSEVDKQLKKIRVIGEIPVVITNDVPVGYLSWNTDDTIIYAKMDEGIRRISADGKHLETIIKSEVEPFFTPRLLPDGKSVLFTLIRDGEYRVVVQSLESGERKELLTGSDAYYSPTGHLVYMSGENLCTVPFDLETLDMTGENIPRVKNVLRTTGAPQFAYTPGGTLVYLQENEASFRRTLHWVSLNGVEESLSADPDAYSNPRISPDGRQLVLSVGPLSKCNISIWEFVRPYLVPLTFEESINNLSIWSPDGQWIDFFRQGDGNYAIHRISAKGSANPTDVFINYRGAILPECWVGEEEALLVTMIPIGAIGHNIGMLSRQGDDEWTPIPLLQEEYSELQPQISPDGRWMAYTSNKSDNYEVWVSPFPEVGGGEYKVSISGGDSPLWSPDGKMLFYRNGNEVMGVEVKPGTDFRVGTTKRLFKGTYVSADMHIGSLDLHPWDINPDGRRFLMMRGEASSSASVAGGSPKINVILHWDEEMK